MGCHHTHPVIKTTVLYFHFIGCTTFSFSGRWKDFLTRRKIPTVSSPPPPWSALHELLCWRVINHWLQDGTEMAGITYRSSVICWLPCCRSDGVCLFCVCVCVCVSVLFCAAMSTSNGLLFRSVEILHLPFSVILMYFSFATEREANSSSYWSIHSLFWTCHWCHVCSFSGC